MQKGLVAAAVLAFGLEVESKFLVCSNRTLSLLVVVVQQEIKFAFLKISAQWSIFRPNLTGLRADFVLLLSLFPLSPLCAQGCEGQRDNLRRSARVHSILDGLLSFFLNDEDGVCAMHFLFQRCIVYRCSQEFESLGRRR